MADEKPDRDEEITPKGAVEVEESDLDQAAGGISINFNKFELKAQKFAPTDIVGAGPGAGPHVVPEKKL